MVNKKCARCLTTVYPIEELKCLDKVSYFSHLNYYNLQLDGPSITDRTLSNTPSAESIERFLS